MSAAQLKGGSSPERSALRRALEETKSDMGLLDATGRRRALDVLKPWDRLKTAAPANAGEPVSFDAFWRETGT